MIVLDAPALVHRILGTPQYADFVHASLTDSDWAVPEHFLLEAASGIRGSWLGRDIDDREFRDMLDVLANLPLDVWPTRPLLPRIRELAHNATTYEAAYLALAEELGVPLVTTDKKLASVPGIACRIVRP